MAAAHRLTGLGAALVAALTCAPAHAERLVIEGPELSVTTADGAPCGSPVEVTVRSGRPGVFERGSAELQRVVDAVRAALAFECPDLAELRVLGRLQGLPEPVFRGLASAASGWSVEAEQTIRSDAAHPGGGAAAGTSGTPDGLALAGLHAGMSLEAARAAIVQRFAAEPQYDPGRGLMTLYAQGCPVGFDWERATPAPQPGWKCLKARFTGDPDPRLARVELLQAVEPGQGAAVEQSLVERFGPPAERREESGRWWRGRADGVLHLGWGPTLAAAQAGGPAGPAGEPRHALRARIEPGAGAVVTTLTLESQEAPPPGPVPGRPDLTL
jgi:hypothetical protein